MAIRYETPEDFEREKLKDQASHLHHQATSQSHTGLVMLTGSLLLDLFNYGKRIPGLALASNVLWIGSFVEMFKSWSTSSKAHGLERERDRMGPQTVILPKDGTYDTSCGCSHASKHAPKTHAEYAAKSADILLKN